MSTDTFWSRTNYAPRKLTAANATPKTLRRDLIRMMDCLEVFEDKGLEFHPFIKETECLEFVFYAIIIPDLLRAILDVLNRGYHIIVGGSHLDTGGEYIGDQVQLNSHCQTKVIIRFLTTLP